MVRPPEVLLFYRINLAILDLLFSIWIQTHIVFSRSVKIVLVFWWGFHWICILILARWPFLTILILPIHEHGRSFHLLIYSLISFFKDLKLLSYRSFTCLVRVIPRYSILFVAILKGFVYLISFSSHLSFVYRRATDFVFELILYSVSLLKVFINCRSSQGDVLGLLMYTILLFGCCWWLWYWWFCVCVYFPSFCFANVKLSSLDMLRKNHSWIGTFLLFLFVVLYLWSDIV